MSYDRVPNNGVGVVEMQPMGVGAEYTLVVPPNPTSDELQQTIMNRRVEFNISKYVNEGWVFTKHNLCQFIGIGILLVLISVAFDVLYLLAMGVKFWRYYDSGVYIDQNDGFYYQSARSILIFCAFAVARTLFFAFPIVASMYKAVFIAMRNNTKIQFKDFFSCFTCPYWFNLMGMGALFLVGNGLSLLFWPLFIPVFYFQLTSIFAIPLHVDHFSFIGIWNSLYFSFKIFHRYFCSMLGFLLLLGVMQILGALCFLVGLFVTIPVAFVSCVYCYHHLVGVNGVAVLVPSAQLEGVPVTSVAPAPEVVVVPQPVMPVASAPNAL